MPKIKILPQKLADQIAAGEVVERPASVVKELIENALDAEATFVEVIVKEGGKEEIKVKDDGEGMDKQDAEMAVRRYATSKVFSEEDLTAIATFGFRGEALSSIAAVSKLTLKTATENAVNGVEVSLEGGKQPQVSICAHPRGTTILVQDLFYNVPARRKFLKTTNTEFRHIRDVFKAQALITPAVGFTLVHNDKVIYSVPDSQSWPQRITSLLEWDLDHFSELELTADYLSIKGYLALPELARKRRVDQYLFVNQRPLYNKTVSGAIYSAYQDLLPKGIHPPYVISIDVREDLVDVNVHPRKEEVRFVSPNTIYSTVKNAVNSSLSKSAEDISSGRKDYQKTVGSIGGLERISPSPSVLRAKQFSEGKEKWVQTDFDSSATPQDTIHFYDRLFDDGQASGIYQLANQYLLAPVDDGLLIYDQHAAEERILLEDFAAQFKKERRDGSSQELLFDERLDLVREDRQVLQQYRDILENVGFQFRNLDNTNQPVYITAIPLSLKGKDIKVVLYEFIDDLQGQPDGVFETGPTAGEDSAGIASEDGVDLDLDEETRQALVYLACRGAVKKGDFLTEVERRTLVAKLENLRDSGLTCPHGRPTRIKISLTELDKMFKRT